MTDEETRELRGAADRRARALEGARRRFGDECQAINDDFVAAIEPAIEAGMRISDVAGMTGVDRSKIHTMIRARDARRATS